MNKLIQYFKDVQSEMAKVSWPTREELTGSTTLVIFVSIVIATVVKGFDLFLSQALKLFLR